MTAHRAQRPRPSTSPARRRGVGYVLALLAATLAVIVGLSTVNLALRQHRAATDAAEVAQARELARAALDIGLHLIRSDDSWRTNRVSGTWIATRSLGSGEITLSGVDPADGDLADDPSDSVLLTGTAVVGRARQTLAATVEVSSQTASPLSAGAIAGVRMYFNLSTVNADAVLHSNAVADARSASVRADVHAVAAITGSTYRQATVTGADVLPIPASTVIDDYAARATVIDLQALGVTSITRKLFSPQSNPYGTPNAEGIYLLRGNGGANHITMSNCRVFGTLIVENLGTRQFRLAPSVHVSAATTAMPALLVRGNVRIETSGTDLSEATAGVNFNPAGAPYFGSTDTDTTDTYPALVNGLVYATGTITTRGTTRINGVLIGNRITFLGTPTLSYDASLAADPPPGFEASAGAGAGSAEGSGARAGLHAGATAVVTALSRLVDP